MFSEIAGRSKQHSEQGSESLDYGSSQNRTPLAIDEKAARDTFREVAIMSRDLVTQQTRNSPHEEVARRAYRFWAERGCPIGSPQVDWWRAEEEIRDEQAGRDEWVRDRNKRVRAHRDAPEAEGPPAFSDHSGQL